MSATETMAQDQPQLQLDVGAPIVEGASALLAAPAHRTLPERTVAIIKHHALQHRLDIETRISEAGFEIVKERQMEIDAESDPDTLVELFGAADAPCFAEGPVWVYILERPHAISALLSLLGPADPAVAKDTAPSSLRALFGASPAQNGLAGSVDADAADTQIASLFASSPPFPPTELPSDLSTCPLTTGGTAVNPSTGSLHSVSSSVLADLRAQGVDSTITPTSSSHLSKSPSKSPSTGRPRVSTGTTGSPSSKFKARPAPSSTHTPTIQPRLSRAAALRTGLLPASAPDLPHVKSAPRAPVSKERLAQTFADVPGHAFRTSKVKVESTRPPAIAPRMTKAASLRVNGAPAVAPAQRRASMGAPPVLKKAQEVEKGEGGEKKTFDGVPGHKRRESFTVASTRAPTLAPRLNKAAALRGQKENGAPPPSAFRGPSAGPGLVRSNSQAGRPSLSRAPSAQSIGAAAGRALVHKKSDSLAPPSAFARSSSALSGLSAASRNTLTTSPDAPADAAANGAKAKGSGEKKLVRRPSSIAPPAVMPKQNRAAMLRAQKMEAEARAREEKARKEKVKAGRRRSMMV